MGLRMAFFKAALTGQTKSLEGFLKTKWVEPPDRNTEEWLKAFCNNPRLSPINKIATDIAAVPGRLFKVAADGARKEITAHPFLDFMRDPSPLNEINRSAFWRIMEIWGLLKGDQIAIVERDRRGYPLELWPVPPNWVSSTPYVGNPYYTISSRGTQQYIPMEDVFVIRDLDPLDPYGRGHGIAEAIANEVETDAFMAQYAKAFFYNNATPPTIISAPGMTETDYKRFKTAWTEYHGGVRNAHRFGILNYAAAILKTNDSAREMDFVNSRASIRDAVIAHFGIPPEIMGVVENSNRASITQAKIIYAENVLKPRLLARQDAINAQLLASWGEGLLYEFEDIVPQDEEFTLEVSNEGLSRGALMVNEWRAENGFDETPNGDVFMPPMSVIPVGADESFTEPSHNSASDEPRNGKSIKARGRGISRYKIHMARLLSKQERDVERQIRQFFAGQMDRIITAMSKGRKAEGDGWLSKLIADASGTLNAEAMRAMIETALHDLIDWDNETVRLESIMRPIWQRCFDGGAKAAEDIGIQAIQSPIMTERLLARGFERLDEITDTTKKELARSIAEGVAAGDSTAKLAKRVQEHMPIVQTGRARVIATTEAHTSIMAGNMEQMRNAGLREKMWVTAEDGDVRDSHSKLNQKRVPIDKPFENGLMYPGDPSGPPGEIINCRCIIASPDFL